AGGTGSGNYGIGTGNTLQVNGVLCASSSGHTISYGDWSSVVCASDLVNVPFTQAASGAPAWQLSGATVSDPSGLTFNGPFYWFSGTMTGAGLLTTGASSTTTLNGNVSLTDKRWDNYGALNISARLTLEGLGGTA